MQHRLAQDQLIHAAYSCPYFSVLSWQVWHQKLTLDIDIANRIVWGSTEIDVVQKTEEVQITLHAQQMTIESIALINPEGTGRDETSKAGKSEEVKVQYQNRASEQVVPRGEIGGTREIRDVHNFTLKYKSWLSASASVTYSAQSGPGEQLDTKTTYRDRLTGV